VAIGAGDQGGRGDYGVQQSAIAIVQIRGRDLRRRHAQTFAGASVLLHLVLLLA
jgi:hypothetical protein